MYNQGNFAPQHSQGPPAPPTPPYPTGHPPPPLQYQQCPPAIYQQGLIPPPVIQQGLSAPAHGQSTSIPSTLPVCTIQTQTVRVQPPRVVGQGYPPHGSAPRIPSYATIEHNPSYSLPVTTQNLNQVGLPLPLPPRVIPPPPPSQSQMLYRAPPRPSQSLGMQSFGHCSTLPPPPQVGFDPSAASPSPSFATVSVGVTYPPFAPPPPPPPPLPPPPPPPPPPPSSPPPLPPSPSSPVLHLPSHDNASDKPSELVERNTDNIDKVQNLSLSTTDAVHDCDLDSTEEDGVSSKVENLKNISPPPVKPVDEEVVRNIEVLCQFIAKVGPDFEDLARSREAGNPKFAFLFGGDPGSTAAIGHEYFQWMKRKCHLGLKSLSNSGKTDQTLMHSELDSSLHTVGSVDKVATRSPVVSSDMDMEDDFNQAEQGKAAAPSNDDLNKESPSSFENCFRSNEQSPATMLPDPRKEDNDHISTWPNADGHSLFRSSPEVGGPSVQVGSPLRHIQGYASDDSTVEKASNDDTPAWVSPSSYPLEDTGIINSNLDSTNVLVNKKGSSMLAAEVEVVVQHSDGADAGDLPKSCPLEAIRGNVDIYSTNEDEVCSELGKFKQEEDGNHASVEPRVDEFGRLLREDATDSDPDDISYYSRERHRKGGRKGIRSRSPKRSRWKRRSLSPRRRIPSPRRRSPSPRRRRDRRSQSRSWSPRRSKTPDLKSMVDFGGKKVRRDIRGQSQECFNFLKGRCYRGSSCRFMHSVHSMEDATRHYNSREKQFQRSQQDYGNSASQDTMGACKRSKRISKGMVIEEHYLSEEGEKGSSIWTREDFSVKHMDEKKDVTLARDELKHATMSDELVSSQVAADQLQEVEVSEQLQVSHAPVTTSSTSMPVCEFQKLHTETTLCPQETSDALYAQEPNAFPVLSLSASPSLPFTSSVSHPLPVRLSVSHPLPVSSPVSHPLPVSSPASHPLPVSSPASHPLPVSSPASHPLPISSSASQPLPISSSESQPLPISSSASQSLPVSSSVCHPLPVQTFSSPPNPVTAPTILPFPNQLPFNSAYHSESLRTQPFPLTEFQTSSFSAAPSLFQSSQLPSRPPGEFQSQSPPREAHLHSSAEHSQPQPFPSERVPSYPPQLPDYHYHHVPPKPMWTNLPPPPPLPPRGDTFTQPLIRAHPPEELLHSRTSELHPVHVEAFRPKFAPFDNLRGPPYGVQSFKKGEQFTHSFEAQEYRSFHPLCPEPPSNSLIPHFSRESPQVHSFSDDNLSHRSFSREIPSRGFSYSSHIGDPGTSESSPFTFSSSLLENLAPKRSTSAHYNPFASTFEQIPTSSKFGSSIFRQETDLNFSGKYDSPFNLCHVSVTEQEKTVGLVSRSTTATSDSSRLGEKLLSKSGESFPVGPLRELEDRVYVREPSAQKQSRDLETGDQYDPIFDSIEPSSNSLKKLDSTSVHDDPKPKRRSSTRHRPPDVEETNKQKDDGPAIINPPEKEAFDETDTEEIGDLDNMSTGNPVDNGGEIEIDQVPCSPEKNKKKSKDSRSMKLFKVALANFVKEVLKPSWRQGNMSKEAFKTIVKKTVDKVSGAMQGRRIPKTQAKIDQYVESSQRKLTKLIMGYVDKYVKV